MKKQAAKLYLSISNNKITGIIEKYQKEQARFEYDFNKQEQGLCILNFCYYYGKFEPFDIVGKNNKRLYDQMLLFFRRDEKIFNEMFLPPNANNNINYPETFEGFVQCEFVRDKLNKTEGVYFLDSILDFGKYKNKTIREIMNFDQQYIKYLIKQNKNFSSSVLNIFN